MHNCMSQKMNPEYNIVSVVAVHDHESHENEFENLEIDKNFKKYDEYFEYRIANFTLNDFKCILFYIEQFYTGFILAPLIFGFFKLYFSFLLTLYCLLNYWTVSAFQKGILKTKTAKHAKQKCFEYFCIMTIIWMFGCLIHIPQKYLLVYNTFNLLQSSYLLFLVWCYVYTMGKILKYFFGVVLEYNINNSNNDNSNNVNNGNIESEASEA